MKHTADADPLQSPTSSKQEQGSAPSLAVELLPECTCLIAPSSALWAEEKNFSFLLSTMDAGEVTHWVCPVFSACFLLVQVSEPGNGFKC